MNTIKEIQSLNERELDKVVPPEGSWHADYRDTAYIYIGGLSFDLSEGDIITIFSQFGEPVYLNLIRGKETGKSKGFAFLKYEDQRSTDLAIDNLGGATVLGRILKVDHTRYKRKEGEDTRDNTRHTTGTESGHESQVESEGECRARNDLLRDGSREGDARRPRLPKEEIELKDILKDHVEDDPMKEYLIRQKKEEIAEARNQTSRVTTKHTGPEHKHHHHRSHRSRREKESDREERQHRSREVGERKERRDRSRDDHETRGRYRRSDSR